MSSSHHSLPRFLQEFPGSIRFLHAVQRWVLPRNHFISGRLNKWLPKIENQLGKKQIWVDWGCGEGLHLYHRPELLKGWERVGYDKNTQWIQWLQTHSNGIEFEAKELSAVHLQKAGLTSFISVLQYVSDPLELLNQQATLLDTGSFVMVYLPVDHHQYSPWYRWAFRNLGNYESANNRKEPLGLLGWEAYIYGDESPWEILEYQPLYHALAAVGHEQFSMAQMLLNFSLQHPNASLYHRFTGLVKLLGACIILPTWLMALALFYLDKLFTVGKPNSVWVVLQKK